MQVFKRVPATSSWLLMTNVQGIIGTGNAISRIKQERCRSTHGSCTLNMQTGVCSDIHQDITHQTENVRYDQTLVPLQNL